MHLNARTAKHTIDIGCKAFRLCTQLFCLDWQFFCSNKNIAQVQAFWWVFHSSYYTMAIKHVFEVRLSGCRPLVMHDSRIYILKQSKSAFSKHMHIGPKVVNLQFKQHCTVSLLTSTQASNSLFVPWQELMYINNQYI